MNILLKLLQILKVVNEEAFWFIKRQEYKIKSLIHRDKLEEELDRFYKSAEGKELICLNSLSERYIEHNELSMYLRENYQDKYPAYIVIPEVLNARQVDFHCFELILNRELENTKSIRNFYNRNNDAFAYIYRKLSEFDYMDYKAEYEAYLRYLKATI